MTDTIDALCASLTDGIETIGSARSANQRNARIRLALTRGVALRERLEELNAWLGRNWEKGKDETYIEQLRKAERGWNCLTGASVTLSKTKPSYVRSNRGTSGYRVRRREGGPPEAAQGTQQAPTTGRAVDRTDAVREPTESREQSALF